MARRVREMVELIDYDNFKDACPDDRHVPYLRVWAVMNELQERRTPRPKRKRKQLWVDDVKTDDWVASR